MTSIPDRINLVHLESQRLNEYLQSLSKSDLEWSSACDLWTVADVIGHLAWATNYFMTAISQGIEGDLSPPEGWPPQGTADPDWFADFIAQRAISERRALGDGLLPVFSERCDEFQALLSKLTPEELQQPCYSPFATRPAQAFVVTRVQELAVHGWDIQSKLETSAHLFSATVPVVWERFPQWLSSKNLAAFGTAATNTAPVRYRFALGESGAASYDIVAADGNCGLDTAGGPADVTLRCQGEAAGLLAYGRLPAESVLAEGEVGIEGDVQLASELLAWLKR